MSPITNLDGLVAGLHGGERLVFSKESATSSAANFFSLWRWGGTPGAGAIPPTGAGEAPTSATAGAMPFTNPTAPALAYLAAASFVGHNSTHYMLVDRLVHTSGLNGTLLTAQAVNSAALTRFTDGKGVELWLEQYVAVGATARTATITYTNEAGVAGRTATAPIGSSSAAGRMHRASLQAGDSGVRSVQDVTLSGSTGTAGDFGVTLLKMLANIPGMTVGEGSLLDAFDVGLPQVPDNACLSVMALPSATTLSAQGLVVLAKN